MYNKETNASKLYMKFDFFTEGSSFGGMPIVGGLSMRPWLAKGRLQGGNETPSWGLCSVVSSVRVC